MIYRTVTYYHDSSKGIFAESFEEYVITAGQERTPVISPETQSPILSAIPFSLRARWHRDHFSMKTGLMVGGGMRFGKPHS